MLLKDEYTAFLRERKRENTVCSYIRDINKFGIYLNTLGTDLTSATKNEIDSFLNYMQQSGQAVSSVQRMAASLRSYYGFLIKKELLALDPTGGISAPKPKRRELGVLTAKETEAFLKQPECINFKGYRDKAMLELIYATGIKATELINLKTTDLNLDEGIIICGSGEKKRAVPLGKIVQKALKAYLEKARATEPFEETNDFLFVNTKGSQLSRQGFWKIIKYYKEKANISCDINSNTLRHSFAVHLIENGADSKSISQMLGVATPASARVYENLVSSRLKNVYKTAHPRA